MSTQPMIGPIPQMGYGTFKRQGQECYDCVAAALDLGYRHLDTAQGYGNEAEVGAALEASGLRSEVFVTTKVPPEKFGPGEILPSVRESLDKLRMDRVDMILLHWPSPQDKYPVEAYASQLAECYDLGLMDYIGVSNFTKRHLDEAIEVFGNRQIMTNQCEIHVYLQNRPIVDYCQSKRVPLTAHTPMSRGLIAGDPVLGEIGTKHDATVGQVALAFLMAEGHIVIPSSTKRDRIAENFAALDVKLDDADMARIRGLDRNERLINGAWVPVWDV